MPKLLEPSISHKLSQEWMLGIHQEREKENKNVHTSVTLLGACRRRSTRLLLASAGFAPHTLQLLLQL
jgi:hypothetical protein